MAELAFCERRCQECPLNVLGDGVQYSNAKDGVGLVVENYYSTEIRSPELTADIRSWLSQVLKVDDIWVGKTVTHEELLSRSIQAAQRIVDGDCPQHQESKTLGAVNGE